MKTMVKQIADDAFSIEKDGICILMNVAELEATAQNSLDLIQIRKEESGT